MLSGPTPRSTTCTTYRPPPETGTSRLAIPLEEVLVPRSAPLRSSTATLYRIEELVSAMNESDFAFVGTNSLLLLELVGETELLDVVVSPGAEAGCAFELPSVTVRLSMNTGPL